MTDNLRSAVQSGSDYPLSGYTVADLSSGIAGAYCTKLLTDAGARIIKVEPPEGDPLRRWSASGTPAPEGGDQPLFSFLFGAKQSVALDPDCPKTLAAIRRILDRVDAVVWSPDSPFASFPELTPARMEADYPQLVVASLTPFGIRGPWAGRPATEFTLQAWSGGMIGLGRGTMDRAPFCVGGQVGEWISGLFAAIGLLAGRLRRKRGQAGGVIDLSELETSALSLTYYPVTFVDMLGAPRRTERAIIPPGVSSTKDGLIGIACGTAQQRTDLYTMVGHPEWNDEDPLLNKPDQVAPSIAEWISERTLAEVADLASAFRVPNSPVGNAALIPDWKQIESRGSLVPSADSRFLQPRSPFRISSASIREPELAPTLGQHTSEWTVEGLGGDPAAVEPITSSDEDALPLTGLRVLDLTAYWAGPMCTHTLALLGAEVIHVESTKRPDGGRLVGGPPGTAASWWELSPIHLSGNAAKKDVTLDFSTQRGRELLMELISTCDVIVENYTPRVLNQIGLDWDGVKNLRPDLLMVRMPGFGLDGPWRDIPAFAYVIEHASGLTWITGYPDDKPVEPFCVGDPNAGLHAVVALLIALENRDRTGQGALVEAAMIDSALNIMAEQFIEYSANGVLLTRSGNRGPAAAPQNLYQVAGIDEFGRDDMWVALAVANDNQWEALRRALGEPEWSTDERLATAVGRHEHHDLIDAHLAPWFRAREADEVVSILWSAGVPVAKVMQPHRQIDLEQLETRGFLEEVEHPIAGTYRQSTLPFHWPASRERLTLRHAPLLGEHNEEILTALGVSADELAQLEADGVIGTAPIGMG